jgi:L-cysteine desulfidase
MTEMTVVPTGSDAATATRSSLRIGHGAVLRAIEKNTLGVAVPALGTVRLPPLQTLGWLAGLTALAVLEIIEWPVAVAVGAGHVLAQQTHMKLLHDFGEALEEA